METLDAAAIVLCFVSEQEIPYDYRDEAQQRRIIAQQFSGLGWRTAELLAEIERSNSYGASPTSATRRFDAVRFGLEGLCPRTEEAIRKRNAGEIQPFEPSP